MPLTVYVNIFILLYKYICDLKHQIKTEL
jgi:hypothetical protein